MRLHEITSLYCQVTGAVMTGRGKRIRCDAASDTFRVRLSLPSPDNMIPAGTRCAATLPDGEARR
jgi:hypothetical protein